jgi:hypothetical protein
MDADDVSKRGGKKTKRVGFSKLVLGYEREFLEVVKRFDILWLDSEVVQLLAKVRDVLVNTPDDPPESDKLEFPQLFSRHAFMFFIPNHLYLIPFSSYDGTIPVINRAKQKRDIIENSACFLRKRKMHFLRPSGV